MTALYFHWRWRTQLFRDGRVDLRITCLPSTIHCLQSAVFVHDHREQLGNTWPDTLRLTSPWQVLSIGRVTGTVPSLYRLWPRINLLEESRIGIAPLLSHSGRLAEFDFFHRNWRMRTTLSKRNIANFSQDKTGNFIKKNKFLPTLVLPETTLMSYKVI